MAVAEARSLAIRRKGACLIWHDVKERWRGGGRDLSIVVIEAGVVTAYVSAWALRKARRVGDRLDTEADGVIDAGLDKLHEIVENKLGGHPVVLVPPSRHLEAFNAARVRQGVWGPTQVNRNDMNTGST
jgi:hypothetical protein